MQPIRHDRIDHAVRHAELQHAARRMGRHSAFALAAAAGFALAALALIGGGIYARDQLAAADDPVKISDRALDRAFDQGVAQREIQSALDANDADLAQSFLELAKDRNVAV